MSDENNEQVDWNDVMTNWFTTDQVAEMTGLKKETVAIYCDQGKFKGIKIDRVWRVNPDSIEDFQKRRSGRPRKESED